MNSVVSESRTLKIKSVLKNLLCGLTIGSSMLVPGVSGGTTAIILGIYDKLISAVGNILHDFKKSIIFLVQIAFGGIIGVIALSGLILWLVEVWELPMMYFFMGAIFGSIPMLIKKSQVTIKTLYNSLFAFIGIGLVLVIGLLPKSSFSVVPNDFNGALLLVFSGIIIAIALVLPGISTSHILLVLGMYEAVWGSFRSMNFYYLFLLGIGVIIGTLSTTKIIDKAMTKFPQQTFMIIVGFVMASVYDIFPGVPVGINILYCGIMTAAGFTIVWFVSRLNYNKCEVD